MSRNLKNFAINYIATSVANATALTFAVWSALTPGWVKDFLWGEEEELGPSRTLAPRGN